MASILKQRLTRRGKRKPRQISTREVRAILLPVACLLAFALWGCSPAVSPSETASLPTEPVLSTQIIETESSPSPIPTSTSTSTATLVPIPAGSPTPTIPPTQDYSACLARGGHLETSQVSSDLLKLPMEYRVYLPPCYDQQSERRYPVLYLIHGQNYNDDQWDRLGVDETLDGLVATGEIPPFIVVMPRDRSWAQPEVDMFGRVVMETLLPWIDKSYRTLPERRYRAIGGLSRGAGWAIHLGLSEWESFGAIGAHSLPVFWTDLPHLKEWLDTIPRAELPRIYLDLGDKDRPQISKSAVWFEDLLTGRDIPHEWHLYPGYHEEAYWQAHLEEYLRWYAAGWEDGP
jgi:enterochelin esterase-like enzyme